MTNAKKLNPALLSRVGWLVAWVVVEERKFEGQEKLRGAGESDAAAFAPTNSVCRENGRELRALAG